jgi:dTDP-4-dehydrorhamnose 3,5-epimerase-like enzyme
MKNLNEIISLKPLDKKTDHRGWFLKAVDGNEEHNPFDCEVYFTNAKPRESKGGHYHLKAKEWFTLLKGKAELILIDTQTNEKIILLLDEENPITVYVPEKVAHIFKNISDTEEFILAAFTDKKYDPTDTIIYNFS